MLRLSSRLVHRSLASATRPYTTHIPRVSSVAGNASAAEHTTVETFAGDVTFNEDIAMERFHEKAIATDSMRAAADSSQVRVVPSASAIYQNINIVYGH